MRVVQLGSGTPEIAVVGGIHGDEPSGALAVERLIDDPPALDRAVKAIVANERALERNNRYVDVDLNRAFPGDPQSDSHEARLAATLLDELAGCVTLSLHSTQSFAEPFAIVRSVDKTARNIVPRLPVSHVVETGDFSEGRLLPHARTIEIECGRQGSAQAVENANRTVRAFLAATGATSMSRSDPGDVDVFRLRTQVAKPPAEEYAVTVESFEHVPAGTAYARANGRTLTTDTSFYPVLMSAYGYERIFGYKADRIGRLDTGGNADFDADADVEA